MRKEAIIKPTELLQQINKIHRTTFVLVEQYAQGEQGAFAIVDSSGKHYVLKWRPDLEHANKVQYVREVTDHLRTKGYPAPAYVTLFACSRSGDRKSTRLNSSHT